MTVVSQTGLLGQSGVRHLFPPGTRRLSRRPGRHTSLLVLPRGAAPRMLVPVDVLGAADMLNRHSTSRVQRVAQDLLSWSLRSGLLPMLPVTRLVPVPAGGRATIEDHVREHVPGARSLGVLLGPPRANGKPVLRVFDGGGRTVAFGKVAHDDRSARLVQHEAAVLADLSRLAFSHLEVPRLVHHGEWNGRPVLFQTPLSVGERRAPVWELPLEAVRELAESGPVTSSRVADSPYVQGLRARVDAEVGQPWLRSALDGVLEAHGDRVLAFGRWHGDWAPWNTGSSPSGREHVWDWERSTTGVPLGFDVVHFAAQRALRGAGGRTLDRLLEHVRGDLSRWCPTVDEAEATVQLYVVEVLHRYVADGGPDPTPALRRRMRALRSSVLQPTGHDRRERRAGA